MPRDIQTKIRDPYWWLEQGAHALLGGGACLLTLFVMQLAGFSAMTSLPLGQLAGTLGGSIYELVQNWGDDPCDNDLIDSHFDLMAFFLGSFLCAWAWGLLA